MPHRPTVGMDDVRKRRDEARDLVEGLPAEETPLSATECYNMASALVVNHDPALEFATFLLLFEQTIARDTGSV
jgi:hypothetical protein